MKSVIFALLFLVGSSGFAQERNTNTKRQARSNAKGDTAQYSFNNDAYIFTPQAQNFIISRIKNNKEEKIGKLFNTTSDGYYIMTTTPAEPVSFGKFDEQGNFSSFRYDAETDSIIEESFKYEHPEIKRELRGKNDNN
ncbi:hypothetical protein [Salinimicrobium sp. GXAS 041]|uniref:hypothetical protein n=1 Tax=Salinimicrobium sp. GXAS 041 TaxID=3400806 RepID=UPI003C74B450